MTAREIMLACAGNSDLFARLFFPKTMRQKSPPVHGEVWQVLENPLVRFVNLKMSRGFGKTTLSRIFLAKRVAYALSHTILYIASSESKAAQSVMWLRSRLATKNASTGKWEQTPFAKFFGLKPGSKWSETELEIINELDGRPIWILGVGLTSDGIRGINFDDYRPDLIYCDDILTDENSATKDQRAKLNDLVFGAVKESLAPVSDEPNAKMVLDQTPHNIGDISSLAEKDPSFSTVTVPCWTLETLDLPIDQQVSAWEDRYPTATMRQEKRDAVAANRYSIFAREKECRLVTAENANFKIEWLANTTRTGPAVPMHCVLAIDPVPPPSEAALARGMKGNDYECQAIIGRKAGEYHIIDYVTNKGHDPNWSVATALGLALRYRVSQIVVESVAYQRTLKFLIEQEMKRRGLYFMINAFDDRRPKTRRIVDTISGIASNGRLWIGEDMHEFRLQFETYPTVDHDDVLDACAMGLAALINPYLEPESARIEDLDEALDALELVRNCP